MPSSASRGRVCAMVRAIFTTREITTGGALPSCSIALTRLSATRMSLSVGGGGATYASPSPSLPRALRNHDPIPTQSARDVESAGGVALVMLLHPVEVGLRLLDLGLQHADRRGHVVEGLELELVDGVH